MTNVQPAIGTIEPAAASMLLEDDEKLVREMEGVYDSTLGPIRALLNEPDVVEVSRLPDRNGRIKVRRLTERGQVETLTDTRQTETDAHRLTQRIAFARSCDFTDSMPELRVTMPVYGYRFTALRGPLTNGVFWTIRRRIVNKVTLEQYVAKGQLSTELYGKIIAAIRANARFAVVGPQSVGKTVFLTAVLRATAAIYPDTFFVIVEDAWEVELEDPIMVLYITMGEGWGVGRLVPTLVRTGGRSLNVGEVTSGADALIEAYGTGVKRTSGFTVHGDYPAAGYNRLEQLLYKENKPLVRTALQQAVTHTILLDNGGPGGLPRVSGLYAPTHLDESGYYLAPV